MAKHKMGCDSEHHSAEIRKISNGFVVRKSRSGPDGHESSEEFHAKRPSMETVLTQSDGETARGEALRDAISHIRGK